MKFDEIDIIKSLRHLKIINNQTYSLFFSFYNTKSSISRNDEISEEYLFSFFNLLKVELLEHKFVKYDKDKHKFERRKNRVIEKRRKEDLKENDDLKEETKTEDISMINPVHLIIKEKLTAKELYNIKDKKEDRKWTEGPIADQAHKNCKSFIYMKCRPHPTVDENGVKKIETRFFFVVSTIQISL